MSQRSEEQKEVDEVVRRLMVALFLHAKISSGQFGPVDTEVKFARELANAAMKEPKAPK
jgi:hypothetical protein